MGRLWMIGNILQLNWKHKFAAVLTHWGRVTHICVGEQTIIGSDNGLSPGRRQAIIWSNAGILSTEPLGTNVSEILIEIYTFSLKKMHLKMSSGKWRPSCLGLGELTRWVLVMPQGVGNLLQQYGIFVNFINKMSNLTNVRVIDYLLQYNCLSPVFQWVHYE